MDQHYSSRYYETSIDELFTDYARLWLISKVFKEYLANGKTINEFAEEYGCDIVFEKEGGGIQDIKFHNDSNETMFMLKYNT